VAYRLETTIDGIAFFSTFAGTEMQGWWHFKDVYIDFLQKICDRP
jgi:hypothetical protein